MRAVEVPFGAVMLDMLTPLTPEFLKQMRGLVLPGTRTGVTVIGRYLENLTVAESDNILAEGYLILPIGESRPNGYIPSAGEGTVDGSREVSKARALSYPTPVHIVCDLEGMGGTAQNSIDYADAWAENVQAPGYGAIAYVGAGVPLSPSQLYFLQETLYWHSLSSVQEVATCDYAMIQGYPTQTLYLPGGYVLPADVSFIYRDKKGRGPIAVAA